MRDVPPRPTPFPLPSKAPTFWGFGQCQGWGWVGARAGLVLGMITPPSTPLPLALFSSGSCQGKGGRRRPYDAPIFPAPSPASPPKAPCSLLARHGFPGQTGGGRGRYGGPTPTLPPANLTLKTPNNAPTPTRTACRAPPHKNAGGRRTRQAARVGEGAWGV